MGENLAQLWRYPRQGLSHEAEGILRLKSRMRLTIQRQAWIGIPENKIHIDWSQKQSLMGSVIRWFESGDYEVVGSEGWKVWRAWMFRAICGAVWLSGVVWQDSLQLQLKRRKRIRVAEKLRTQRTIGIRTLGLEF